MTDFKELREGDGYMPVLLTSAASIAVILKKLSRADSLEKNELVSKKFAKKSDLGEKIENPDRIPESEISPDSLFTELMGNSIRKPAVQSDSDSEEEIIIVKRRRK